MANDKITAVKNGKVSTFPQATWDLMKKDPGGTRSGWREVKDGETIQETLAQTNVPAALLRSSDDGPRQAGTGLQSSAPLQLTDDEKKRFINDEISSAVSVYFREQKEIMADQLETEKDSIIQKMKDEMRPEIETELRKTLTIELRPIIEGELRSNPNTREYTFDEVKAIVSGLTPKQKKDLFKDAASAPEVKTGSSSEG